MHGKVMTAAAAFAAANLDDLLLLTLLFAEAGRSAGRYRIVAGQLLGMGALTAACIAGGLGLGMLPAACLRLLGLIPILLAVRMCMGRGEGAHGGALPMTVMGVAGLAIAGGGDNLGLWLPLFAGMRAGQMGLAALLFLLLTLVWCALGAALGRLPLLQRAVTACKGWLVPLVFLLLGISILLG